jgi:leader peptidase (prepilin peptidase)/N-methyltransferase
MNGATILVAGVFGLPIGSFLGVVVDRVPKGESIIKPGSHCSACAVPIRASQNVPVLSYLVLRGRCRSCGARIPAHDLAVELLTAALFATLAWRTTQLAALPAFLVLGAALVALSLIDLEHLRLPTPIIYATAALGVPLLVLASVGTGRYTALAGAAIGAAIGFGVFFLIFFLVPKAMGFGDVRLAALCGAFLGWIGLREVAVGLLGAFVIGGVVAIVLVVARRASRRSRLPFGPFLAAGTLVSVMAGPQLARLWLG